MVDSFDAVERLAEDIQAAARRLDDARMNLEKITGEAEGADGHIHVTVDGRGGLLSLELNPRIRRLDSAALTDELTKAIQAAQAEAREKTTRATNELIGPDLVAEEQGPKRFEDQVTRIHEDLSRALETHLFVVEGRFRING